MGVARANDGEIRDRTQGGEVLDRLVRRAVFAEADRVVRKDKDRLDMRQGRKPDRRPHVIRKRLKRSAKRYHAAVQGHAVHRRAHRVFADAVMDIAVLVISRPECRRTN